MVMNLRLIALSHLNVSETVSVFKEQKNLQYKK